MTAPHDVPTAAELVEAVREWIVDCAADSGSAHPFAARVAANVLAIVGRELELGPEQHARHVERLAILGVADDVELAAGIKSGRFDDRLEQVRALVRQSVVDKLAVANPRYLNQPPEEPEPVVRERPSVTG